MDEQLLLKRITVNPKIFGGKPIIEDAGSLSNMCLACWLPVIRPTRFFTVIRGWNVRTFKPAGLMPA